MQIQISLFIFGSCVVKWQHLLERNANDLVTTLTTSEEIFEVTQSDEACACVWSSVCGAFDTETQLTGLEEVRQAEVQTAKEQESFNALDKKLGAEEEFIQRRQSNDMCRSINEVAILRGPLQIVRAFSADAQMGVPMLLKMVAEKVYYAFISSSSAALSSACANISFRGNEEEITHVAKFQEVKHSKKLIEK
ncbi:uncharacterized protein MONOS_8808 [Monocercomonoides exilis]|uniref:uncharacterized protein n=1 Tax=Monocercomonoides exilis TaxID=2049356 RepID=UPI0035598345|nr:hypothetical protein MONOS_8808 [Monocercomonoides exilis]|eukprot:MONOS_8808.1-p1 / transcript=MONOS_8808.1 / gene=MONOS_8808 / organism=Monocercomonoides_exilis_PA203 / gene_product=unspecified product / transcript_product=unspecified product / location=Mono_scaffold00343:15697-16332(-) / protein_length=193 / sequence_SO=supercontig / SO=protein_coding / is_pseudo=false